MTTMPPGTHKLDFDTPILCIDLAAMESNTAKMSTFLTEHGKHWRPHAKTHKSPEIARQHIAAGAIGITCAKVSEAAVMAEGGVHDILIANMIVGAPKVTALVDLCRKADPIVTVDHFAQAQPLATACQTAGVTCRVLVDIDIGMNRVGLRPGRDAIELATAVDKLGGLQLSGITGYEGHLMQVKDADEKRRLVIEAIEILGHCRDRFHKSGLCCDIVSAGGTGTYQIAADCDAVTEIQAGAGIFGDLYNQNNCSIDGHTAALTILATVISRPSLERAILDAGRKTLAPDKHPPIVKNHPDAKVCRLSAEHCELELGLQSRDLQIGDKVELVVGHADLTTVLHDHFYAFRDDVFESSIAIKGRGKLT